MASALVSAKIEMQLSKKQAGTTPLAEIMPLVGLRPTMLVKAAGARPEPAVSVPKEKLHRPEATATPKPELEPPEINVGSNGLRATP